MDFGPIEKHRHCSHFGWSASLVSFLALVIHGGKTWWVWAWMLVGGFELLLLWLFPVVIVPLFNKFDPIENKGLEERIRTLMEKVGLRAKGIFKMDASKRSKHTNAFFIGIGGLSGLSFSIPS